MWLSYFVLLCFCPLLDSGRKIFKDFSQLSFMFSQACLYQRLTLGFGTASGPSSCDAQNRIHLFFTKKFSNFCCHLQHIEQEHTENTGLRRLRDKHHKFLKATFSYLCIWVTKGNLNSYRKLIFTIHALKTTVLKNNCRWKSD